MKRREFLESMAVLGVGSALLPSTASAMLAPAGESPKKKGSARLDEDLVCIVSDLHVRPGYYQQEHFEKTIEEILALRPRPANVLCLGDIAYLTGKIEEYEAVKQGLSRLEEAGIRVAIAMGNHDRRANFAQVFPEKASASELPHRMVFTVETPKADFILLDSLQEGENHDKWIVPGAIDERQMEWLSAKLSSYIAKPVFVLAHSPYFVRAFYRPLGRYRVYVAALGRKPGSGQNTVEGILFPEPSQNRRRKACDVGGNRTRAKKCHLCISLSVIYDASCVQILAVAGAFNTAAEFLVGRPLLETYAHGS